MKKTNKTALAKKLGISRSSLYYKSKMTAKDIIIKERIEAVLETNPAYGHKRIAIKLKLNKKRILRIMKKFKISPIKQKKKPLTKPEDRGFTATKYKNYLKIMCPLKPNIIWASDFTYIKFQNKFIYVATIIDVFTREIVGIAISNYHSSDLVKQALKQALLYRNPPIYLHSDQGSEYRSENYINFAKSVGCIISMAAKGKPWENPFQESFYSNFKLELGNISRFSEIGELIEAIYNQIHYYNNNRIHTAIKMAPIEFAKLH